jgi:hypothetical protein
MSLIEAVPASLGPAHAPMMPWPKSASLRRWSAMWSSSTSAMLALKTTSIIVCSPLSSSSISARDGDSPTQVSRSPVRSRRRISSKRCS